MEGDKRNVNELENKHLYMLESLRDFSSLLFGGFFEAKVLGPGMV